MKQLLLIGCIWSAAMLAARAAEEGFSKAVQKKDFSAAGLTKLSPEELARLDVLVRDYKSGALAAARRETEAAEKARAAAETRAVKAATEAQATKAEADARVAKAEVAKTEPKKSEGGFLAKAKALLPAGTEVEFAAIESRIVGDFAGWEGRPVFTLENGQRWQIANAGSYFTPVIKNPAVKITPASFGGFWMTIEGVRQRVRVESVGGGK
jgi:hypothetical protein